MITIYTSKNQNGSLSTNRELVRLAKKALDPEGVKNIYIYIFFYQGFLSQTLTTYRTAGEGRGPSYSTLPLPPAHEHSDIYSQLCT